MFDSKVHSADIMVEMIFPNDIEVQSTDIPKL